MVSHKLFKVKYSYEGEKEKGSVSDLRNILTASNVSYVAQLNLNVSSRIHETDILDPLPFFCCDFCNICGVAV